MDRLTINEFQDRNANQVYSCFLQDRALIKKKQVKSTSDKNGYKL